MRLSVDDKRARGIVTPTFREALKIYVPRRKANGQRTPSKATTRGAATWKPLGWGGRQVDMITQDDANMVFVAIQEMIAKTNGKRKNPVKGAIRN